jgi:hypothetical protein
MPHAPRQPLASASCLYIAHRRDYTVSQKFRRRVVNGIDLPLVQKDPIFPNHRKPSRLFRKPKPGGYTYKTMVDSQSQSPCALHPTRAEFVAIALVMIVWGWATSASAQTTAGNVTSLIGAASIQRAGSSLEVTVGMAVLVADEITVSAGGKVAVTLTDGSVLEAHSSSTIVIDEQLIAPGGGRASTRVRLLKGILRSLVKHSARGNPNFEVHTPNAILAARATDFKTSYTSGQRRFGFGGCTEFTDEQTKRGTVGARNAAAPNAPETLVDAGYETTIACNQPPTPPGPLGMTGIPGAGPLTSGAPGTEVGAPPPAAVPVLPPEPPTRGY